MQLSKETTDQIRKEAKELYHGGNYPVGGLNNQYKRQGYIEGASAWAIWKEKALVLVKALEYFKENCAKGSLFYKKAKSAIQQFEINPETGKPYFSGLDPNKFNKKL